MVCYCCVRGCNHNSNMKKRDPTYMVSFHAFPTNPELKMKWLRAIGRPNWNPPSHARICSVHFSIDQICHKSRTRIKDDAYPVNELPLNSNFEASHLKVCRICLAYDLKLYSLQEGLLKCCIESIDAFNENQNVEGLPQFVCFECAGHLIRFYRLLEKSIVAQSTMLNIFAHHGEITETLIKGQDRNKLNLVSTLGYSKPRKIYQYTFSYDNYEFCPVTPELKCADNEIDPQENGGTEIIMDHDYFCMDDSIATNNHVEVKDDDDDGFNDFKTECVETNYEEIQVKKEKHKEAKGNPAFRCQPCNINFVSEGARRVHVLTSSKHKKKPSLCDTYPVDTSLKTTCSKCGEEFPTLKELIAHTRSEHRRPSKKKTTWSLPEDSYPTQCEHCDETVNNRKEHWLHVLKQHPKEKHTYKPVITVICETCGKGFQNSSKLELHELRHSGPRVACPACPRLFYDKFGLARHASVHAPAPAPRPHACARCPRAFRLRTNLDRHAKVHTAATPYECTMCGKKFKYSTSLSLHVRTVHYKLPHPPRKKKSRTKNSSSDAVNENISE